MFPTGFQFFCNKLATLDNTSTRACTTVYPEYIILEMEKSSLPFEGTHKCSSSNSTNDDCQSWPWGLIHRGSLC